MNKKDLVDRVVYIGTPQLLHDDRWLCPAFDEDHNQLGWVDFFPGNDEEFEEALKTFKENI